MAKNVQVYKVFKQQQTNFRNQTNKFQKSNKKNQLVITTEIWSHIGFFGENQGNLARIDLVDHIAVGILSNCIGKQCSITSPF